MASWHPGESDGPETVWARAHEQELIGTPESDAVELVRAAGFRAFVFHPAEGRALAAMQVAGTVTLISVDGVVRRVRC